MLERKKTRALQFSSPEAAQPSELKQEFIEILERRKQGLRCWNDPRLQSQGFSKPKRAFIAIFEHRKRKLQYYDNRRLLSQGCNELQRAFIAMLERRKRIC